MIEVELPDGAVAEFPDGTSRDVIQTALRKRFAPQQPAGPAISRDQFVNRFNPAFEKSSWMDPAAQGLTMGWADEAAGVLGGVVNAVQGKSFGEGYAANQRAARDRLAAYREEKPWAATAAEIGGGLATALATRGRSLQAQAPSLGARVLSGIGTGAIAGGVYGAGASDGDLGDRAVGAGTGAAFGAGAGLVAPIAVRGVQAATRGIGNTIGATARGILNPSQEAARRVALARNADDAIVQPRLTPADEAAAAARGQPIYNIDRGGETTRAMARSAANASPQGRAAMQNAVGPRFEGQGDRTIDTIRSIVGTNTTDGARQTLRQQAAAANRPAYARAYAAGDRSIMSPGLERLMGSPDVVAAMQAAATKGKTRAIADGFGAFNTGVRIENGQVIFQRGKSGVPTYPNLQFWDYTYRELRDAADAAFRAGRKSEGQAMGELARLMRSELDQAVPEFGNARSTAARFFGAEDALEAGDKFVMSRMANDEARRALAKMNPAERRLFAEGFADSLVRRLSEVGDRRNVINQMFLTSRASRERIEMALGPQRARELESFLRVEDLLDQARNAFGNSTTARQLMELGVAGGTGAYGLATGDWRAAGLAMTGILLRRGAGRIDRQVAQRVGELLASPDPAKVHQGLRMVARSDAMIAALRSADRPLAIAAAPQGVKAGQGLTGIGQDRPMLEITVTRPGGSR